jgi:exodeoxyribonuclease VII large subunit
MSELIYSVNEVNTLIKDMLDSDVRLMKIFIRGELSNYKIYPSGHHYFTLKDSDATLKAVMFRREADRLRFKPENGMKVIALGRITVFPRDGQYQLYCSGLTPDGVGDLHVAYEQLKEKLFKEGLFDEKHKKPLPKYPQRIAVITSSAGAAVRDIIRVLGKRFPQAKIILLPVRVQGVEAPPEICGAIKYANRYKVADLIIAGRGGGSIEDLWAFNDERVARTIFESEIPVISAVGHEPDYTISDFVADLRAATPSNAAELAVPDRQELIETINSYKKRMAAALKGRIDYEKEKLKRLSQSRALSSPMNYIDDRRLLLDHLSGRLASSAELRVKHLRSDFIRLASALDAMSPLKVLARGYSIAVKSDGSVIKRAADTQAGEDITVKTSEGSINCKVL